MSAQTNYWKLGFFVLAGVAVALVVIVWIGAARLARETIDAHTYFNEPVSGLEVGSWVKFRGVSIGKVAEIATAPDRRHVEVRAELFTDALERLGLLRGDDPQHRDGAFAPADLRVQLVSSALTGITYIESDFFDVKKYPVPKYPFEVPANTIHSVTSTYKTLEEGMLDTLYSLPPLVEQATRLMARIETSVDQMKLQELSSSLRSLLQDLQAPAGPVHRIADRVDALGERFEQELNGAQIDTTLAEFRRASDAVAGAAGQAEQLGADLRQELTSLDETLGSVRRAGDALAGASGETGALGRELRDQLTGLGETLRAIRRLADLLERDPGALIHGKSATTPRGQVNR